MSLLNLVSFIKRGKNRKKVFMALDKPIMPSELVLKIYGKSSNTYFNLVSRALKELKNKRLVKVVNPKERTGRLYKKTEKGLKVLEELEKIEK
jgi:predicted transcriptional regulator